MSSPPGVGTESAAAVSPPAGEFARNHIASHLRLWLVAGAGLALDLWSKHAAFRALAGGKHLVVIPGWLELRTSVNAGALFGKGAGLAPVFIAASVVVLGFVLYLFAHSSRRARWLHIAFGLILAGALGNLYDRAVHRADAVWENGDMLFVGRLVAETPTRWHFGEYPDGGGTPYEFPKTPDRRVAPTPVVRDFIHITLQIGGINVWPWIFNLADTMLVLGVSILVLHFLIDALRYGRASPAGQARDDSARSPGSS